MNQYVGRFAPSPTGDLHLGSLVCALASYLDARAHRGKWLIRIEDIDPPREPVGAAEKILSTLNLFGFESDDAIVFQSHRYHLYEEALERLKQLNYIYGCSCSRREIAMAAKQQGHSENVYPGTCRSGTNKPVRSWRFKVAAGRFSFHDRYYGVLSQNVEEEVGDFVLKRADGFWAYQLAVVVDDGEQGINNIVRGADLLDNTPRQILLQQALSLPHPTYMHIPLVLAEDGKKLSKQNGATELNTGEPDKEILRAWKHLGFEEFKFQTPEEFLKKAIPVWSSSKYFRP